MHLLLGHIRNIHFPFDIGADTSVSVASEMVEELELSDQDVSTIAMTIDSEIRYHIPSWNPSETPDNNSYHDSGHTPETMPEASPITNDSPGSLALEILPSGRKYWSDSPKGVGGSSPCLHSSSNFSHEMDVILEEGALFANSAEKECDGTADSPFSESITSDQFEAAGEMSFEEEVSVSLEDSETEDIDKIVSKLETLLGMQREELDELKKKHQVAVSDFLNEFSPEISLQLLSICNLQLPDSEV